MGGFTNHSVFLYVHVSHFAPVHHMETNEIENKVFYRESKSKKKIHESIYCHLALIYSFRLYFAAKKKNVYVKYIETEPILNKK